MNSLSDLQLWFASNCDDNWEHDYGVAIQTDSAPGWSLSIELTGTNLEDYPFSSIEIKHSENDWYHCQVTENRFEALGDPHKLETLIEIFLTWAKSQKADWLVPPPPLTPEEEERLADLAFYQLLAEQIATGHCNEPGCEQRCVRYSVKCLAHHFEMVKKRPLPEKPT